MPAYNPPNMSHYTQLNGLESEKDMFYFIGKGGIHFKTLTDKLGLHYLWWNKEKNIIEIWGPENRLVYCKTIIEYKMNNMYKN